MRILGIDPGYAIVGYGVVDYNAGRFAPVEYGAITTPAHTLFEERLVQVYDELAALSMWQKRAGSSCLLPAKREYRFLNTRRYRSSRR